MPDARRRPAPRRPDRRASRVLALALGLAAAPAAAAGVPSNDVCMHSYETAQRMRLAKKLKASRQELIVCANQACPAVLRQDCTKWLGEVERSVPSVVIEVRAGGKDVGGFELHIDDDLTSQKISGAAVDVDPGEHAFRVEASDGRTAEQSVVILEGEKNRKIELDLPEPRAPEQSRNMVPVYGLAAVGVIGIGSFAFFGLRARAKKSDLESCKGHCPVDDVDAVRRDQIVGDVSLGLGVIALGAATWLYFGQSSEAPPPASARFELVPGGAALSLAGRY
jgi:hypothetical protein